MYLCNLTRTGPLLKIISTYVTFAAMWVGRYCLIAIDDDCCFITEFCSLESNKRKYIYCGRTLLVENWILSYISHYNLQRNIHFPNRLIKIYDLKSKVTHSTSKSLHITKPSDSRRNLKHSDADACSNLMRTLDI
jgi:hypothetical protein